MCSLRLAWLLVHIHAHHAHLREGHCISHPLSHWWPPDPTACVRENSGEEIKLWHTFQVTQSKAESTQLTDKLTETKLNS